MNNFDSQTFPLGHGGQGMPGGAVFDGQQLVYWFRTGGYLSQITCTPPSGQDPWTAVSPPTKNWAQCWTSKGTGIAMTAGLSTPAVMVPSPTAPGTEDTYYHLRQLDRLSRQRHCRAGCDQTRLGKRHEPELCRCDRLWQLPARGLVEPGGQHAHVGSI